MPSALLSHEPCAKSPLEKHGILRLEDCPHVLLRREPLHLPPQIRKKEEEHKMLAYAGFREPLVDLRPVAGLETSAAAAASSALEGGAGGKVLEGGEGDVIPEFDDKADIANYDEFELEEDMDEDQADMMEGGDSGDGGDGGGGDE